MTVRVGSAARESRQTREFVSQKGQHSGEPEQPAAKVPEEAALFRADRREPRLDRLHFRRPEVLRGFVQEEELPTRCSVLLELQRDPPETSEDRRQRGKYPCVRARGRIQVPAATGEGLGLVDEESRSQARALVVGVEDRFETIGLEVRLNAQKRPCEPPDLRRVSPSAMDFSALAVRQAADARGIESPGGSRSPRSDR